MKAKQAGNGIPGRNSCSDSTLRTEAQVQRSVGERSATTLGLLHATLVTSVFLHAITKGGSSPH